MSDWHHLNVYVGNPLMSSTSSIPPFHLAFPVHDLDAARAFYGGLLGCAEGRSTDSWIDFNFWGHQLVAHLNQGDVVPIVHGEVDGKSVPTPHFGAVLEWDDWHTLKDKLVAANLTFVVEPYIRFAGQPGEQATLFIKDPSGNALEFKSFKGLDQLFATD